MCSSSLVGVVVTLAPTAAGRAGNTVRFVPYATDRAHVRAYRATGVVMVVAGVVAAFVF